MEQSIPERDHFAALLIGDVPRDIGRVAIKEVRFIVKRNRVILVLVVHSKRQVWIRLEVKSV
jgi:hypothetical protein